MFNYEDILNIPPFSLKQREKEALFLEALKELTLFHGERCREYRKIMSAFGVNPSALERLTDIPFLPVRLFKEFELLSITKNDVFKKMTSSGTTGQAVSKIFLDRETAAYQQKTLVKIVSDFTGASRMPMLIIDHPSVIKDRTMFSARGAGILGFSIFGADTTYILDENMNLNIDVIEAFLKKHAGKKILLFGFTYMVWEYFYKKLRDNNYKLDLSDGTLIHGGGWKKLADEAVSKDEFKKKLGEVCHISRVHDYYGMIEQTGCIYMECDHGHMHASIFSDIITRRSSDFSPCSVGEKGIIQVLSLLPKSYPGHSLITEDEGTILGENDCPCGRNGKYFEIAGRVKNAEIRGCSDTYERR